MAKRTKPKYTGELAKPIPRNKLLAEMLRSPAPDFSIDDWLNETHARLLRKLLDHYKIVDDRSDPWLRLAYQLALDHVPGFAISEEGVRPVGRPKTKAVYVGLLGDMLAPKKAAGRPPIHTKERQQNLIRVVQRIQKEEGLSGRGKNKEALRIFITKICQRQGYSASQIRSAIANELPNLEKRLADAFRANPEIKE
ncbi:MAG: hypothetical protein HY749_05355 [Gammaproteobacteria bacterium]|nr:hypothetical protein [Gammaproteobacteria bacterium]